jgi:hypothetical protein
MNVRSLTKGTAATLLAISLCACAQTPDKVTDRTPSWQRYEVLGSRITRRVDASGQPASAHHTVTTSGAEWADLPAVSVKRRR